MYRLLRFGDVELPDAASEYTADTAVIVDGFVPTVGGGVYDALGGDAAVQKLPYSITLQALVHASTAVAVRAQIDDLRALVGSRDKLFREALDTSERQWCWARLRQVRHRHAPTNYFGLHELLDLEWVATSLWVGMDHRGPWYLDDGNLLDDGLFLDSDDLYTLSGSPQTITLTNGGNRAQNAVTIRVTAGSAPITAWKLGGSGWEWQYTGTIAAGKTLVVNTTVRSVDYDGVDAYAGFGLTANHGMVDWCRLTPGANTLTATWSGGGTGSTIQFKYRDGWA